MSIFIGLQSMMFSCKEHYDFYIEESASLKPDVYLSALIYTVGISGDTRRRWKRIYDEKTRQINPEVMHEGWQTSGSKKIIRLAFQLFTDGTPTALDYDEHDNATQNFAECQFYSVSDIFCSEFAPFFVEAIKLRYPEYFAPRRVYLGED